MIANIDNISYVKDEMGYHIITEFSRLPIETFQEKDMALEFMEGYVEGKTETANNIKGKLFKLFVDTDIRHGVEYRKVKEISESILIEA